MTYITPEYYQFLKKLAANNNRDWFVEHKDAYQNSVFKPFKELTESVISKMQEIDASIQIDFKQAAFRIYRDIRFSRDKSPYKLWMGAVVNRIGRKNTKYPEIYFQFGPGENFIAAGLYRPDKEILQKIRMRIARFPKEMEIINNNPKLRQFFKAGIQGERNKRLSAEWMQVARQQEFILNKQFYTIAYYPQEKIINSKLDDFIVAHYLAMQDFNKWLMEIVSS